MVFVTVYEKFTGRVPRYTDTHTSYNIYQGTLNTSMSYDY